MHIWLELISRELLFLLLLFALGSGPAAFLPSRFGDTVRFCLAPALGLCVGVCLTVTLVYEFPTRETSWLVVACAALSVAVAVWRLPRLRPPRLRNVGQVAIVVVVVLASFSYPLAANHTVGPAGGYTIADAGGYVNEIDGEQRLSIRQVDRLSPPFADRSVQYWWDYAGGDQQLDVSALEASVNPLLGLGSTDTYSPFLITVLLVGALGAFAAVCSASGTITWPAVLAGCLFTGPVFTQLFMDGSEAALTGCAVIAPLVLVGWEAVRRRETATLVLLALLGAGLQTLYPLFVPCVVIGAAVTVGVQAAQRLRRGRPPQRELLRACAQILGVVVLAAVFTPEAFARNFHYWTNVLNGGQSLAGLPGYYLPINVLPGWVLQTREFYGLVDLRHATFGQLLGSAVVPALLIGMIALAVLRNRLARVMLAVAIGAMLLAYYTAGRNCSYCVQRNLIPVDALAVPVVTLALAAFAALRFRGATAGVVLIAVIVVLVVGRESIIEHRRLERGSYLLDSQVRQTAAALPSQSGPVELEGFGQGPLAPMEEAQAYDALDEKTAQNVSLPTATDDNKGLFYLGGPAPLGPSFRANYQYVLTRLAGIATRRRLIARHGPIALERRTHDLDVTITGGVSVASEPQDPTGTAWVAGTMEFLVVGGHPGQRAWISLVFDRTVPVTVLGGAALAGSRRRGRELDVCLRAAGSPPVRAAGLQLAFAPQPSPAPAHQYAPSLPAQGVRLVSMSVASTSCRSQGGG